MLVLSRRVGEEIVIDIRIRVTILSVTGSVVRIGIAAPADIAVDRAEVHHRRMEFIIDEPALPATPNSSSGRPRVKK